MSAPQGRKRQWRAGQGSTLTMEQRHVRHACMATSAIQLPSASTPWEPPRGVQLACSARQELTACLRPQLMNARSEHSAQRGVVRSPAIPIPCPAPLEATQTQLVTLCVTCARLAFSVWWVQPTHRSATQVTSVPSTQQLLNRSRALLAHSTAKVVRSKLLTASRVQQARSAQKARPTQRRLLSWCPVARTAIRDREGPLHALLVGTAMLQAQALYFTVLCAMLVCSVTSQGASCPPGPATLGSSAQSAAQRRSLPSMDLSHSNLLHPNTEIFAHAGRTAQKAHRFPSHARLGPS